MSGERTTYQQQREVTVLGTWHGMELLMGMGRLEFINDDQKEQKEHHYPINNGNTECVRVVGLVLTGLIADN